MAIPALLLAALTTLEKGKSVVSFCSKVTPKTPPNRAKTLLLQGFYEIGAGEGNRTLITDIVVNSGKKWLILLAINERVQYAYCTNCTMHYGLSVSEETIAVLVHSVH